MMCYACCCKIQFCRFFLHFFWILLLLLVFVLFILGFIFGFISFLGKDGVDVLNFLFSKENLSATKPIIIGGTAGNYLNICLNGNFIFIFLYKINKK
jgi:hypothetical protein